REIAQNRSAFANIQISGIHMHIGSQITQSQPYIRAIKKAGKLMGDLKNIGIKISFLNIGGGLGIVYDKEKPQTAKEFAAKVVPLLRKLKVRVILEPGRFIAGSAGVLLTKVTYVKENRNKNFIIVDAAMNDLIRPSLYGAYHKIIPLVDKAKNNIGRKLSDVVGPICESGDFLGKDRQLAAARGDFLAVMGAGAYGFAMSSNYNSRPRAAEVLVSGKACKVIRKRETYKDLVDKEIAL
ncbi:MAG: diaminopimelate decarboxylase, partial [Candidatus Omnitrophica bacterium]|nr:diaminopimelate decarboxylase [Candidatus Omnitrophota bacterium]